MKAIFTNIWFWVVLVIAVLLILLKVDKNTIRELMTRLMLSEAKLEDSKILNQLGIVESKKQELEKKLEAKPEDLTPDQVEEFWDKD